MGCAPGCPADKLSQADRFQWMEKFGKVFVSQVMNADNSFGLAKWRLNILAVENIRFHFLQSAWKRYANALHGILWNRQECEARIAVHCWQRRRLSVEENVSVIAAVRHQPREQLPEISFVPACLGSQAMDVDRDFHRNLWGTGKEYIEKAPAAMSGILPHRCQKICAVSATSMGRGDL